VTPPPASAAIGVDELEPLFGRLRSWPLVVLAVSGGADSLAMLHLFARWHARNAPPAPAVLVVTVDHGLRASSAEEARFVAREAAALGLPHETLAWVGGKPATGIADAARKARYHLMTTRLARAPQTPRALVTAHTQDDQAETLLMRLARGSGVDGLSAMASERPLSDEHAVTLVRPLLAVPKARLIATLQDLGRTWIEDETNADERFERPRWRAQAALRVAAGLSNAALSLTARRLARARDALEASTGTLWRAAVATHDGLWTQIARGPFEAAPLELRIRLLSQVIADQGGDHPAAALAEVERLADRLGAPGFAGATLGGCLIEPGSTHIAVYREPGRDGLHEFALAPGTVGVWDGRFCAALAAGAPGPCQVRALTPAEWRGLDSLSAIPDRAAITVPGFWVNGRLVSAPSLCVLPPCDSSSRHGDCRAPQLIEAAFAPFCAVQRVPPRSRTGETIS
jgi:tRNA(Ile)-lysidine synthase